MEDSEKQKAIEQVRKSIISSLDSLKTNFDGIKSEIAKGCMIDVSIVKNINSENFVFEEGVTLESIINNANEEIKKAVDSITIAEDEIEEMKKSMLKKIDFELDMGEVIFYKKVSEMASAYVTINQISNSLKNTLLTVLTSNKN